jgi:formate dehydrogenase maturation protein FdhE
MSSILLQLESALADARASQERAAEKLHDTGVQHALAKSQYDAAAEIVKRTEGAAAPSAPIIAAPAREPRKPKAEPDGPECPGCGDKGTLGYIMRGTVRFAQCSACKGEFQS